MGRKMKRRKRREERGAAAGKTRLQTFVLLDTANSRLNSDAVITIIIRVYLFGFDIESKVKVRCDVTRYLHACGCIYLASYVQSWTSF